MRNLILLPILLLLLGCGAITKVLKPGAAVIVDAGADYCEQADEDRETVRALFRSELVSEDMELCLGCPGQAVTECTGTPRPKVDDPGG